MAELYQQLIDAANELHRRGWCLATGGNFSGRLDKNSAAITKSGQDKGQLTPESFLQVDLDGQVIGASVKPSAETLLHTRLYQLDPDIGAVLHTHSVTSTVLSSSISSDYLVLRGYEMQKALQGNTTHDTEIQIRIFDNTQDIAALADQLEAVWISGIHTPGFLVRGHGLYAWGSNVAEARRHVEGLEFLFSCELEIRRLGGYTD